MFFTLLLYLILLFAGDPVTYIPIGWHHLFTYMMDFDVCQACSLL